MKLNPKQAPLYGECVLTVQLGDEECVEEEEDVEFYLLFSGSTQRHLTTTLRIGHVTLQAVCPAHDRDEAVRVTLCQVGPGGSVDPVAEERFQFVQDLAVDMAHFLVSAATHRDGLEGALLLTDTHINVEECERLDHALMLALKHLPVPPGWSVLGPDLNTHSSADFSPHETLLHFAARRGLRTVALFLLQQPGGRDALRLVNKQGHTPARVAQSRGHTQLQHLLSELEKAPHLERKAHTRSSPAGRWFQQHSRLNTFSLTVENTEHGEPADLQRDVDDLRHYAHTHTRRKTEPRQPLRSFPLILSRDLVCESQPSAVSLPEDASDHKPPAREQEVDVGAKTESIEWPNGGLRSEECKVPASGDSSGSGTGRVGLEVAGVCVEKRENSAAVSTVSCGEQQKEEVDNELKLIREPPETTAATNNKIQSGNRQEDAMGQTPGLLPERGERNASSGDLPEEREGERKSEQETFSSRNTPTLHGQTHGEKHSPFNLNVDVNVAENTNEIQETGSSRTRNPDTREGFRSNMAPGPVHNVRLHSSSEVQQLHDVNAGDQIDAPSGITSDPPPCDDVTDVMMSPGPPDRLLPDVSPTADQISLPEMKESSSPLSEPGVSTERSEETSQIISRSHCGGEELSQKHDDSRSDLRNVHIVDVMHQESDRSQSPLQVLEITLTSPSKYLSDSIPQEERSGHTSKLEKESQTFQTLPESPCEFFCIDGFSNKTSLELPVVSQETTEEGVKVETELLEMCESSKRSPVTVLCGSFSKLTIRGSPLGPQLDHMTSNTIERAAEPAHDDLEISITFSSEAEETKEEVIKLEPEFGETCERTETCEEPPTVSVSEENLKGTAAVSCSGGSEAQIERPPESQDIQEAWIYMKISTQLVETSEVSLLPCESLLSSSSSTMLMASVLKNITDPQLEFMTFEEENNKTSTPTQSVLLSSTETTLETSPCPKLEVSDFKENIREPPEVMTLEESNTGRSPDLHHDLITSSEGTTGKTSVEIFSEVKLFEDQQLKVMTSEESTSVELIEDVSHVSLGDVTNCEEVQQHEKSTNASLDFKHELMNFEESNKRTHEFHPGLITTSEESIRETFCGLLPEVSSSEENIRDQQPEVMNSEESMRGTSFGLAHDLNLSSEETCSEVSSTEENVLDQSSKHGTSQQLEVATSENSFQNTHREVAIGETSPEQEPEITVFEGSVGYSPDHTQLEETTCEENLRTSVDPSPEFLRTNMDTHVSEVETVIPESFSDSRLALENVSTSEPLEIPDQPVELDIGAGVDLADCPPVGVDSGLIQDLASSDGVGVHDGGNLEEVESHTEEEHGEELAAGNAVHTDNIKEQISQSHEIHREEDKVLYSLHSDDLQETCSKEFTETDVVVASVCHAVSATSLPRSESVSDGDSTNDTAFIQNEDTLTLTSGISMTRSVSTDDSSITHAVIEPEEEEKKDRLSEFLERSAVLCSVSRSHAPSRRHSWEPSKDQTGETSRRSVVHAEDEEKRTGHRRSMSWCPSHVPRPEMEEINTRSYSLEGLADEGEVKMPNVQHSTHSSMTEREERGSLASLTEEENENNAGDNSSQRSVQDRGCGFVPPPYTLTKSVSMSAISPRDLDSIGRARPKRRISFSFSVSPRLPKPKPLFAFGSSSSDDEEAVNLASGAVGLAEYSISEEDPAPLKSDSEVRATKVSRTFSYLKSKMTKKSKEKDRDRNKDGKEKEKKSSNGHLFNASLTPPPSPCVQCNRPISMKDAVTCTDCSVHVHKGCRDAVPMCAKVKMKQQTVTDSIPAVGAFARGKSASARERPWSTFLLPEDQTPLPVPPPRKTPGVMAFNSGALSKSISISNIAGQSDEAPLKALKILSQSSESLSKTGKVNESTESLTDEGAELVDTNLMVEFEADVKQLEADSWSFTVDKKYLKQLKKDVIKRQDVIYELIQTELHHVRILRIMAEVYSKGLQKEVQVEVQTLEMMFPVLEELMELHTHFLTHLLERRREARDEKTGGEGFIISRIGDVLLDQVTGSNGEKMKKVYGKFCSRHNEAVNIYKEFYTRDKRFQAFIKKKMSSAVVRRLSIPECILLVTQRITKYPVLLQRLLQHTREPQEEQDVSEALRQMKEVLMAVDGKVNEFEKRTKLKEIHSRTDSKSIMRMKSGQMFAREDLIRGRKLLHDGPLQLKNAAGRLKDVHALLLSDVFVFLQEKDQKYVFASLDQRSTVISLQKLIIREVANEERGLFFITAGIEKPEMVEVHASSKDERNTWMQLIQNTTTSIDKDDDEGIPSEKEEDKRLQESKAKEMKDQLQKKDEQIVTLLEEKVRVFRELCECVNRDEAALRNKMLFRATGDDVTKGEPLLRDALREVEILQELVSSSVVGQQVCVEQENSSVCAGSVSLPRRAETFGGFDCHQMNISKNGDREEADDLRRTESDSVLKKGVTANLLLLHKRNSEQLLLSVTRVHDLLNTLKAVVVQQDTFIEEQRQALISPSLRHPSVSSSSSSSWCSLRPNSLMEQEKQRQDEKIREEQRRRREEDDRKRREEEEERRRREEDLDVREERLVIMEEETRRRRDELQHEQQELKTRKEEYQRQLLTLRDGQRRLERDRQLLHSQQHNIEPDSEEVRPRSSSTASDDSVKFLSSDVSEGLEVFSRADSKRKAKNMNMNMNPFGQKSGTGESQAQIPNRFLQLAKARDKKEKKKKKKGKGDQQTRTTDPVGAAAPESSVNKDIFFC